MFKKIIYISKEALILGVLKLFLYWSVWSSEMFVGGSLRAVHQTK